MTIPKKIKSMKDTKAIVNLSSADFVTSKQGEVSYTFNFTGEVSGERVFVLGDFTEIIEAGLVAEGRTLKSFSGCPEIDGLSGGVAGIDPKETFNQMIVNNSLMLRNVRISQSTPEADGNDFGISIETASWQAMNTVVKQNISLTSGINRGSEAGYVANFPTGMVFDGTTAIIIIVPLRATEAYRGKVTLTFSHVEQVFASQVNKL